MFLTFLNFIASCTCLLVFNCNVESKHAKQAIASFERLFNDFKNSNSNKYELEARILSRFNSTIEKAVRSEREVERLYREKGARKQKTESAIEDAAFLEFLAHIRSKSEVFKDEMLKCIVGFEINDRDENAFTKIILEKLDHINVTEGLSTAALNSLPQELLHTGKFYQEWILILHFTDERALKQLKLLRELLGRDRQRYHEFAIAMQNLHAVFSKDYPAKLLHVKFMKKAHFNTYLALLSDELRSAVDIFIRSENTESTTYKESLN